MPRVIKVQVWQLGLINYLLQLGVLVYFLYLMYFNSTWAYSEVPSSRVNAFVTAGSAEATWATAASTVQASFPYCGNASYDFVYSAEFQYVNSQCQAINGFELATKLPETAAIATVFMDVAEEGWPCSASDAAAKASACSNRGGTLRTMFGTQCQCTQRSTTYPVSTESMNIALEHAFSAGASAWPEGFSGMSKVVDDAMTTTDVVFSDGTTVTFQPGATVQLSLADWLKVADANISLDSHNMNVAPDMGDSERYPFLRTTGAVVIIDIHYTNIKSGNSRPSADHRKVRATVRARVEKQWAGLAVKAPIYESLPTGTAGAETYSKLLRYSQGVVFKFQGTGYLYRLDSVFLLNQLTSILVLLGLATTFTGYIAKFLWPTRSMIYNASTEKLAIGSRLVQIALQAATHATNFKAFKTSAESSSLTVDDVAKVFSAAHAPISEAQAMQLATMIVQRVNDDPDDDIVARTHMDFLEYMGGMEAGGTVPFPTLVKMTEERLKQSKGSGTKILPAEEQ